MADAVESTDVSETMRFVRVETIAQPHNHRLACGEVAEAFSHAAAYLLLHHKLIGLRRLGILHKILQRIATVRNCLLQLGDRLDGDQECFHLLRRPAECGAEFPGTRSAAMARPKPARSGIQLVLEPDNRARPPDAQ